MKHKNFIGIFVSGLIVIASFGVLVNQQNISDWWKLRNYTPSAEVAALSVESSMSEKAQRLFYIHDPELLDKESFQGKCSNSEKTIILGCYISDAKIYVFDVDDPRLNGVEEVTAAHEMLHVVYDRLSNVEKTNLDDILLTTFNQLNDERLNQTIASYRERDPTIIANELHSILGSEYRNLPAELENHYSKYFNDRLVVVAKAEAYESEFTKREDQIKQYDARLSAINNQVESLENEILLIGSALEGEQSQLERLRSNPDAYNQAVPAFNSKVREYNEKIKQLKELINEYNIVVGERNALAIEEQSLLESIDTRIKEL